jgi:predicted transposase/invertase (TIGR01784 family)
MARTTNPHDALFKRAFADPRRAAPLLQAIVGPALSRRIDWSSLEPEPASFVDDRLGDRHADLLFSAIVGGRRAFLYVLLEHQSSSDRLAAFRLLRYAVRIWERWIDEHPAAERLPVIVPIVVYHSQSGWTAPTELSALLDADASLLETLGPYGPHLAFLLDDLSTSDDAVLHARSRSAFALMTLRLLARARHSADLAAELRRWLRTLEQVLEAQNGVAAFAALMEYILRVSEIPATELRALIEPLGATAGEELMTGAQQLIEQGRTEGRVEERTEMVLKLLGIKFGPLAPETEERVRSASLEELDQYAERLLSAETLGDVFE